jgi:hypothetical protein
LIGPDNAQVGSVNDMLFDKNGKIVGLIVGVGGFLGIGEEGVAIDMSAFRPSRRYRQCTRCRWCAGGAMSAAAARPPC